LWDSGVWAHTKAAYIFTQTLLDVILYSGIIEVAGHRQHPSGENTGAKNKL
jgi:hypothetical protein